MSNFFTLPILGVLILVIFAVLIFITMTRMIKILHEIDDENEEDDNHFNQGGSYYG